jgi:hypothetical protein
MCQYLGSERVGLGGSAMTSGICIRTETLALNGICPANYLVIRAATGGSRLSEAIEHGLLVRSITAAWTRTEE